MDPQIFFAVQIFQDSVRQIAESDLERGSVINQLRYVMPDSSGNFIFFDGGQGFHQIFFVGHQTVNFIDMHKTVTPCSGHFRIHLGNNHRGMLHSRSCNIDRDPQTAIAVFVRRADLDQSSVQTDAMGRKQTRYLGQIFRNIVDLAFKRCFTHRPADKKQL